jgi:hypothetical protein
MIMLSATAWFTPGGGVRLSSKSLAQYPPSGALDEGVDDEAAARVVTKASG